MPTTSDSAGDLKHVRLRAALARGECEPYTGREDPGRPGSYAEYMVRERAGEELPA